MNRVKEQTKRHEVPGLPDTWAFKALSDLNVRVGGLINPQSFPDEIFEYYSIPAYFEHARPTLTPGTDILSTKLRLDSGTLLFGKLNPRVEKVWRVGDFSRHRKIGTTEWLPIVPDKNQVLADFLYFLLKSEHVMPRAQTLVSGSTPSRERIDPGSFYALEVPLPPIQEQKAIAAVLSEIEASVETEVERLRVARELKQAALAEVFSRGLRGEKQRETSLGLLPVSWQLKALKSVAEFKSGGTPHKGTPSFWSGKIPWATPKDMKRPRLADAIDHITEVGLESGSSLVPAHTLLVVIRGMILARDVPIALTEVPMAFNQDMKAILPRHGLHAEYALYAFDANKQRLFQSVGTSAHGTRTLGSSTLEEFVVPVPDTAEQKEIAELFRNIDAKIAHHEARHRLLRELFASSLRDLMTGRRRVTGGMRC